MKHIVFLFLILILCVSLGKAQQYILAGQHGPQDYYHDLVPDLNIGYASQGVPYDFFLDLNNDGSNDVKITSFCTGNQWVQNGYIRIEALGSAAFIFDRQDTCYNDSINYYTTDVIKNAILNDTIDIMQNWRFSPMYVSWYDIFFAKSCLTTINMQDTSGYLGFMISSSPSDIFGWVHFYYFNGYPFFIDDYACNANNTGLYSISDRKEVNVFPNPASDYINLFSKNNTPLSGMFILYNTDSKIVFQKSINETGIRKTIELENMNTGIYHWVFVTRGNHPASGSIIVSR